MERRHEVAEAGAVDSALRTGTVPNTTSAEYTDRESTDIHTFCDVGEYSSISPGPMSCHKNPAGDNQNDIP